MFTIVENWLFSRVVSSQKGLAHFYTKRKQIEMSIIIYFIFSMFLSDIVLKVGRCEWGIAIFA